MCSQQNGVVVCQKLRRLVQSFEDMGSHIVHPVVFFIHKIRISVLRLILSTQFFTADGQTSVADKLSSYSIYVLFDKSMKFLPQAQHAIRFIFRYEGKSDLTYEDVCSRFDTQSRPCYAAAKLPYITNTILVTPAQITVLEKVVLL